MKAARMQSATSSLLLNDEPRNSRPEADRRFLKANSRRFLRFHEVPPNNALHLTKPAVLVLRDFVIDCEVLVYPNATLAGLAGERKTVVLMAELFSQDLGRLMRGSAAHVPAAVGRT